MSRVNELNVNAMWSIYWKQLFPHFFDLSLQPLVLLFLILKIISEKPWVLYCIDADLLSKCINCSNAVDFYKKMKYNPWLNIGNCRTLVYTLKKLCAPPLSSERSLKVDSYKNKNTFT